jgi:cytochrome c-type biogenesis protein CcmH
MIASFGAIAAVLVLAALGWLLVPLMRVRRGGGVERAASNIEILRDQMADLDRDLAAGTLSRAQYDQAREELERRVLEEAVPADAAAPNGQDGRWTAVILAIALPIAAGLLYLQLGNLNVFSPQASEPQHAMSPEEIGGLVAKLEARLKDRPDPEGYVILARSYMVMQQFPRAVAAYERAGDVIMQNPDLLADYADAIAAASGGELSGKPIELVKRALAIDANHVKSLALAGTEAFNRKDYKTAVDYWERIRSIVPGDTQFGQTVASSIAEARKLGGLGGPIASAAPPARAPPASPTASSAAAGGGRVTGVVTLDPAIAAKASPDDTVFIFARAAEGPRMPLAILKRQVKDLPVKFTLDDSQAMTPAMKLSSFPEVVVGARVSKTAQAAPQSGDLEGLSGTIKVGATDVAIVIDKILP